jgi:hypothetical protein
MLRILLLNWKREFAKSSRNFNYLADPDKTPSHQVLLFPKIIKEINQSTDILGWAAE